LPLTCHDSQSRAAAPNKALTDGSDPIRRTLPLQPNECADLSGHPGTAYQYQYDQMGRLSGMQENICYWGGTNCQWYWQTQVMAAYGPANEMTSLSYYGTNETRTYNNLLQLTRQ